MTQAYGKQWSMEYQNEEDAGVGQFSLPLRATIGRPMHEVAS